MHEKALLFIIWQVSSNVAILFPYFERFQRKFNWSQRAKLSMERYWLQCAWKCIYKRTQTDMFENKDLLICKTLSSIELNNANTKF